MGNYDYLFDIETFKDEEEIVFEWAELGSNTSEWYKCFLLSIFNRMRLIGIAYGLKYLSLLDTYGDIVYKSLQIETFIDELIFVKEVVNDELLESYIDSLLELIKPYTYKINEYVLTIQGN